MAKTIKLDLKSIELNNFSGENVLLTKDREVIFPAVQAIYNLNFPITNFYDAFVMNNCFILVLKVLNNYYIYVFNLATKELSYSLYNVQYNGIVYAGNQIHIFYNGNKFDRIDSNNLNKETVTYKLNSTNPNTIKVRHINSQAFLILTSNPTTVFISDILSLLSINSSNDDLLSLSYATYAIPSQNIDVLFYEGKIYLIGDDGTVIISLDIKDIVYLKTESLSFYRFNPIEEILTLSVLGAGFTLDCILSNNVVRVYNKNEDQFIYLDLAKSFLYFSNRYIYMFNYIFDVVKGILYKIILKSGSNCILLPDIDYRFSVKQYFPSKVNFYNVSYTIKDLLTPTYIDFQIESKFIEFYNTYSYRVDYKRNSFIANVNGDGFILHIKPKTSLLLSNLALDFIANDGIM